MRKLAVATLCQGYSPLGLRPLHGLLWNMVWYRAVWSMCTGEEGWYGVGMTEGWKAAPGPR